MANWYLKGNEDLQWRWVIWFAMNSAISDFSTSEGSFRGFFTITVSPKTLTATYYAMNNLCKSIIIRDSPSLRLWYSPSFP